MKWKKTDRRGYGAGGCKDPKLYRSVVPTKIDSEVLGTSDTEKTAAPVSLLPEATGPEVVEAGVPGKTGNVPSLVSESGEAEVLGTTSASNAGGPSSLLSASAISLGELSEDVIRVCGGFLKNET